MEKGVFQNGLLYLLQVLYYFEAHTLPFGVKIQQMFQYFTNTHTHTITQTHTHFCNLEDTVSKFSSRVKRKNGICISNLLLQFIKVSWV
jgi:hypothetical protein